MDIIPITKKNIFKCFDFNKVSIYDYTIEINSRKNIKHISEITKDNQYISPMMMYSKVCAKNAMLMIDDIVIDLLLLAYLLVCFLNLSDPLLV